jgi:hypothetical protein
LTSIRLLAYTFPRALVECTDPVAAGSISARHAATVAHDNCAADEMVTLTWQQIPHRANDTFGSVSR